MIKKVPAPLDATDINVLLIIGFILGAAVVYGLMQL